MVIITPEVKEIFDGYRDRYCSFRKSGEYGLSRFWQWYLNTLREINTLDYNITQIGDRFTCSVSRFTTVTFSSVNINNKIVLTIYGVNVNIEQLERWIGYKAPLVVVGSCNCNCQIITRDSRTFGIQSPNGRILIKPYYDKIIPFHHCQHNYNLIHAIGIKGNRVFAISLDGETEVLPISVEEYENGGCQHHSKVEETKRRRKTNVIHIKESQLRRLVRECIYEVICNE